MKARLTIAMDNAAFSDDCGAELSRILTELAGAVMLAVDAKDLSEGIKVYDINGNRVGEFKVSKR